MNLRFPVWSYVSYVLKYKIDDTREEKRKKKARETTNGGKKKKSATMREGKTREFWITRRVDRKFAGRGKNKGEENYRENRYHHRARTKMLRVDDSLLFFFFPSIFSSILRRSYTRSTT